jgi:hypothetical protein
VGWGEHGKQLSGRVKVDKTCRQRAVGRQPCECLVSRRGGRGHLFDTPQVLGDRARVTARNRPGECRVAMA